MAELTKLESKGEATEMMSARQSSLALAAEEDPNEPE